MDRTKTIYIIAGLAAAIASLFWWVLIIPAAALSIAYSIACKPASRAKDSRLLAFAREFNSECSRKGLNSALNGKAEEPNSPEELRELKRRYMLGDLGLQGHKKSPSPSANEFLDIVTLGLQSGTSIKNNLSLFVSRLEADAESRNKEIQSSMNMDTLSAFGISFFVPLFGGIGSSIIGASGSIIGASTAELAKSLQVILLVYIALMSYVMGIFRNSGRNEAAFKSFQNVIIGAAIIRTVANFMVYAI